MSSGAASINVFANGRDFALAKINLTQGGLAAIDADNSSTVAGTPQVSVTLGGATSKIRAAGSIDAKALSQNDADASSNNVSGGLLRVSVFNVNASMTPTVMAVVTGGAEITAGGTLTLDATANTPLPPISDGTFDAGNSAQVNAATNTITFFCGNPACIHTVETGDVVTYNFARGGGVVAGNNLAGRSIGVIATSPTSVQLGAWFRAAGPNPTGTVTSTYNATCGCSDVIDFGNRPHHLLTGDIIIYSGNIPGLTNGGTYRVFKVDDFKFKLQDPNVSLGTVSVSGDCGGSGCIDNGADRIVVSNTFKNGDFVTYHAPPPVATFGSKMVDVTLDGNDGLFASCGRSVTGTSAGAENIFIAKDFDHNNCLDDSGLSTGDAVRYFASDPLKPIGNLTNNTVYFVIRPSGLGTFRTIQLASTYCRAVGIDEHGNGCQSGPGGLGGNDTVGGPVIVLTLLPDTSGPDFTSVVHTLVRTNDAPINNLQDGANYYVVGCGGGALGAACSTFFQLSLTSQGAAININNAGRTGSPHVFQREGVNLTGAGVGDQNFVLDISLGSGVQQLIGIGGGGGGATSENNVIEASASGTGGGLVNVASASSTRVVDV